MANMSEFAGRRWLLTDISQVFAWFARPAVRRQRPSRLDPAALPADRLRDIGLLDGRGPSLRRPELRVLESGRRRAPRRT